MTQLLPDKSFYPSAKMAMEGPVETCGYLAVLQPFESDIPDAMVVVDLDKNSSTFGQVIDRLDMPNVGDELHHFGWNACSSALCPFAPHPHIERRYLIVPGLRSSRLYIIDIKDSSGKMKIIKTVDPEDVMRKTNYSRVHTVHCGPSGIYVSAIGNPEGEGPGGIFLLDHETFDVLGAWELERGTQYFSYDFWWHLGNDTIITSEWGTPNMIENGLQGDLLLGNKYGHRIHIWSLSQRKLMQTLDLGEEYQMVLELRPAHDPAKSYGFASVVISTKDLSSSIWLWYLDKEEWKIEKVIDIPAVPCDEELLPPILKSFKAVPPLVTDIVLSLDDIYLYVSCWGTGELLQYDVSDPRKPILKEKVKIGGIANLTPHPSNPNKALNGGPQMVECSRDGRRLYFSNSLYTSFDEQFYPDGIQGWLVKVDVNTDGSMAFDPEFFVDFGKERPHQIRLEGGDASSDSYWFS